MCIEKIVGYFVTDARRWSSQSAEICGGRIERCQDGAAGVEIVSFGEAAHDLTTKQQICVADCDGLFGIRQDSKSQDRGTARAPRGAAGALGMGLLAGASNRALVRALFVGPHSVVRLAWSKTMKKIIQTIAAVVAMMAAHAHAIEGLHLSIVGSQGLFTKAGK